MEEAYYKASDIDVDINPRAEMHPASGIEKNKSKRKSPLIASIISHNSRTRSSLCSRSI
jgi:hypothetical protein